MADLSRLKLPTVFFKQSQTASGSLESHAYTSSAANNVQIAAVVEVTEVASYEISRQTATRPTYCRAFSNTR